MQPALTIDPNAVYEEGAVSLALDLPLATLARARRDGTLRYVRRGRRVYYVGRHLLAWLDPDHPTGGANLAAVESARGR